MTSHSQLWCLLVLVGSVAIPIGSAADDVSAVSPVGSIGDLYDAVARDAPEPMAVELIGTMTYMDPTKFQLFIQDRDQGIFVKYLYWEQNPLPTFRHGELVRMKGSFDSSSFNITAVSVEPAHILPHDLGTFPPIVPRSIDIRLLAPGEHWTTQVTSTFRASVGIREPGSLTLLMTDANQSTIAALKIRESLTPVEAVQLLDAELEFIGVNDYVVDDHQLPLFPFFYSYRDQVKIIEPGSARNYISVKLSDLVESPEDYLEQRIVVPGQIGMCHEEEYFILEQEECSVRVLLRRCMNPMLGCMVSVQGRLQRKGDEYILQPDLIACDRVLDIPSPRSIRTLNELRPHFAQRVFLAGEVRSHVPRNEEEPVRTLRVGGSELELTCLPTSHIPTGLDQPLSARFRGIVFPAVDSKQSWQMVADEIDQMTASHPWYSINSRIAGITISVSMLLGAWGISSAYSLRAENRTRRRHLRTVSAYLESSHNLVREAIIVLDRHGELVRVNRRLEELLDLKLRLGQSAEEIASLLSPCFEHPEDIEAIWCRCHVDTFSTFTREYRVVRPQERHVVLSTTPVKDDTGEFIARIWVLEDVTERRRLEVGLRQNQKMEAIGRLAGGIAHDFNNLLMGVTANLELVRMAERNPRLSPTSDFIAAAEEAAERASRLVQQLLCYTRQTRMESQVIDPNDVIRRLAAMLRQSFLNDTIELVLSLHEEAWPICADDSQLGQVLLNLSINARDSLPSDGGRIRIATSNVRDPKFGERLLIQIEDNGSGMSEEVQERMFEPFFTTKPRDKGTGLGLAIAYGIIEQFWGNVTCTSKLGEGSRFDIYLPRATNPLPEKQPASSPSHQLALVSSRQGSILIVDDESLVRESAAELLRCVGFQVETASDGSQALELLGDANPKSFDLIILDLLMPVMSGETVFHTIKERFPDLPVIVSSGYGYDPDTIETPAGKTPDAFVAKPFRLGKLQEIIIDVLNRTQTNRITTSSRGTEFVTTSQNAPSHRQ